MFLIVFVHISCFKLAFFTEVIMGYKSLNVSLKLLLILNMCQCLFIISFIFGSTGLFVKKNDIDPLSFGLQCFKSNDLFRWSTLSTRFLTRDSL